MTSGLGFVAAFLLSVLIVYGTTGNPGLALVTVAVWLLLLIAWQKHQQRRRERRQRTAPAWVRAGKRHAWHHWPWLLIAAAFTEGVITASWGWMAACCGCIAFQLWWWTWTARREERALQVAAALARETERRRKLWTAGCPADGQPLSRIEEGHLAALEAAWNAPSAPEPVYPQRREQQP